MKPAKDIVKVGARQKKAQSKLADASRLLRAALDAVTEAKAGSAGEKKARKAARAAVDMLVAAKRKLKQAQKKLRKVTAKRTKTKARTGPTATVKPKPAPARGSSIKSRKTKALPPTTKPDEKQVEDRKVAKVTAKTNTDSIAGDMQPDEVARVDF